MCARLFFVELSLAARRNRVHSDWWFTFSELTDLDSCHLRNCVAKLTLMKRSLEVVGTNASLFIIKMSTASSFYWDGKFVHSNAGCLLLSFQCKLLGLPRKTQHVCQKFGWLAQIELLCNGLNSALSSFLCRLNSEILICFPCNQKCDTLHQAIHISSDVLLQEIVRDKHLSDLCVHECVSVRQFVCGWECMGAIETLNCSHTTLSFTAHYEDMSTHT